MTKFKIATFNINKDCLDFPSRIYRLSHELKKSDFDILCLQEDYKKEGFLSSKFLNTKLKYNHITSKTREKERTGILSSSNLSILSKYKIKLLYELYFNEIEGEQRCAQFCEVQIKNNKVLLVNTHLCHLNIENRSFQIKKILEKIKEFSSYPFILFCGDLNSSINSPEIKLIKEDGFSSINIKSTYIDEEVYDYIFYKSEDDFEVKSEVLLKGFSDHFCLKNTFVLKKDTK